MLRYREAYASSRGVTLRLPAVRDGHPGCDHHRQQAGGTTESLDSPVDCLGDGDGDGAQDDDNRITDGGGTSNCVDNAASPVHANVEVSTDGAEFCLL